MTAQGPRMMGGKQATLCVVAATADSGARVIKQYRPRATDSGFAAEVEGLRVLAATAHSVPIHNGWSVAPVQLFDVDPDRRRMTMSVATGVPLASLVSRSELDVSGVCHVAGEVLRAYWRTSGTVFGDLTLDNILIDLERRQVTFVDPGAPRPVWHCDGVPRNHWPASRDAGYLIFDACAGLNRQSLAWRARARVAWELLTALEPLADAVGFREESRACCTVHLDRLLTLPTRRWRRRVVRRVTIQRLRRSAPLHWPVP